MGLNTSKYVITKTTQLKDTWYRLIFNNTSWKKIYDNVSTAPGSPTFQNFIKEKLLERGFLDVDFGSASSVSWMLDGVDDVRIRAEGGADSLNYFLDWTGILRVKIPETNCVIKFKDKNNNVVLLTPENEQYQIGNINNGTWQSQYQKDLDPNLSNEERWVNLSRIGAEFAVAQDESSEIKNKGIFYLSSEDERYYQTDAPNPSTDHKKWFSIPLYEVSFGIEQVEPYTWTTEQGKSWTPNQLNFSSMVKYSSILTEDNSDSGDATLLPEISSDTGAEHFLQDDDDYCYIEDNEGNIVYNKLLNTIARKTKINNGYRFNGDQSLELISFNNNIRNNYDKQSGQYLFDNNKKQKYGDKEDKNKINLEQNIPYFGGNPAVYPILVEETYSAGTAFSGILQKRGNKIIYNNKTYNINENDEVILYQRIGSLEMKNEPNFSYEHTSNLGTYYYQIYNMNLKFETTSKTYSLKTNSDFKFDFNKAYDSNIWTETTKPFYKKIMSTSREECIWKFKNFFSSQTNQNASIWWGLVGNDDYFQLNYTGLIEHFVVSDSSLKTPMKFEGFLQQGYLSNPYMQNWQVWGLFSFPYMRGIYTQTPTRTKFNWTYDANENQGSRYTAHISPTEYELYDDLNTYLSSFSKKLSTFTNTVVAATNHIELGGGDSWLVNRYYDGFDDLNGFNADEKNLYPIGWKIDSGSYFSNYSSSHDEQYHEYASTKTFHWCFLPNELPAYAIVIWKNGKLLKENS